MTRLRPPKLFDEIQTMRRDLNELKGPQNVGQANVKNYLTKSNSLYDYSIVLGANASAVLQLLMVHDHGTFGSIQQLVCFYSLDQPDVLANYVRPWGTGPPVGLQVQKLLPTNAKNEWRFSLLNYGTSTWTVYIKVLFSGTDSGSYTFTKL